jgi:hypothetical protein
MQMPMVNKLSSLWASRCPTSPINEIVKSKFKIAKHVVTGNTLTAVRFFEDIAELPFS